MKTDNLILLETVSAHYEIEFSFFTNLYDLGLIEIQIIQETYYIDTEQLHHLEQIIRIHEELNIVPETMDIVLNLLQKIESLQKQLLVSQNRLRLYES